LVRFTFFEFSKRGLLVKRDYRRALCSRAIHVSIQRVRTDFGFVARGGFDLVAIQRRESQAIQAGDHHLLGVLRDLEPVIWLLDLLRRPVAIEAGVHADFALLEQLGLRSHFALVGDAIQGEYRTIGFRQCAPGFEQLAGLLENLAKLDRKILRELWATSGDDAGERRIFRSGRRAVQLMLRDALGSLHSSFKVRRGRLWGPAPPRFRCALDATEFRPAKWLESAWAKAVEILVLWEPDSNHRAPELLRLLAGAKVGGNGALSSRNHKESNRNHARRRVRA
jgi:hypothetical protein